MRARTPPAYRAMLFLFLVAAAIGVVAVVLVGFMDRRDFGFVDHRDALATLPVGAEPAGVTGDGTFPSGTAEPPSPTDTDRASGPIAELAESHKFPLPSR